MNQFRCPKCFENLQISHDQKALNCRICCNSYIKKNNFYDFVLKNDIGYIESKSLETWGKDLHKASNKNKVRHINTINKRFLEFPKILSGSVLEIGCGTGADSEYISSLLSVDNIVALDIGENCKEIAIRNSNNKKLNVVRANCLNMPFKNEQFKYIYSYGVIHHTSNPLKALTEINRVLKPRGKVYLYVYSSHSKNFFKKIGIFIELLLMKFISLLNNNFQIPFIYFLSIFCWFSFSLPSLILKRLGKKKLAVMFPMHWGDNPLKIVNDLKDRLFAPINHRYSMKTMRALLSEANLNDIDIIEDYSGLYLIAQKK